MKRLLVVTLLTALTMSVAQAQAPQTFHYQAVPRQSDGQLLPANQTVLVRFQLTEDGASVLRYAEEQALTVSEHGAIHAAIGAGQASGNLPHNFQALQWASHQYYLNVALDLNQNGVFDGNESFGSSQLLSVPYALYAQKSGDGAAQTLTINGQQLAISGGNVVTLPGGADYDAGTGISINGFTINNTGDLSATNELQQLSLNGNQLSLSNGNSVTLPTGGGSVDGSGTTGYLPRFQDGHTLGNANIREPNGDNKIEVLKPLEILANTLKLGYTEEANFTVSGDGLHIYSAGNGLMLQNSSGNVGIGKAPVASFKLDVGGDTRVSGDAVVSGNFTVQDKFYPGGGVYLEDGGSGQIACSGSFRPVADNSGTLGSSTHRWYAVWSGDGTINTSDARLKRDIQPLHYGLSELLKLRPVSYFWQAAPAGDTRRLGFIAQELQTTLPEVVRDREYVPDAAGGQGEWRPTERLGVAYSEIIPVAVAAIQEQQAILVAQQQWLNALQAQVESLSNQLIQLQEAATLPAEAKR